VIATVFNPGPACAGIDDPNDHSVVLHLQFGEISILLSGDIEAPVQRELVSSGVPLVATVLENSFGHPSPEVIERYAAYELSVLRTDKRGTIEFITDGQQVWVETAR
jgi:competence protein ComEC